ncbi:radical SAM family heme chaperone HemW [Brevirhabdus sp.]|uniref:radical SAM family heme chaperone HemW n=1 Tax=Brevirhabdus sp. TaxID=2004514 RepID=UPI00405A24ED
MPVERNYGFGLYIHWPFCQAKCPYCDFNSHVSATIDQARWLNAFCSEIRRLAETTSDRVLDTVFFGGGTPSMMEPALVQGLMDSIRESWRTSNSFEVTLEANPTSVEAARFAGYRDAGVNRVSMGIQALNDADLKALGRLHTVAEARAAFDIARATFDRVSFDLICARQRQTLAEWKEELNRALDMAADHVSLYQLTIEHGTAFGARHAAGGLKDLPTEDLAADMYELTQELCEKAGLPAYEVSNHARPGAESRHNLIYWNSGDYLGIGPGAHGRFTANGVRIATDTPSQPMHWLNAVEQTGTGERTRETIAASDAAEEIVMMGLRLSQGIEKERLNSLVGPKFNEAAGTLIESGFLQDNGRSLRTTPRGRLMLNAVLRELLTA